MSVAFLDQGMLFQEMLLAARLMQLSTMISLQATWQHCLEVCF